MESNERMPPETWAAKVLAVRERHGLSRAQLGYIFGVDQNTIGRWERGDRHGDSAPVYLVHYLQMVDGKLRKGEIIWHDELT